MAGPPGQSNVVVVYSPGGNGGGGGFSGHPGGGPSGPGGYGSGQVPTGPVGKRDPKWVEEQQRKQTSANNYARKADQEASFAENYISTIGSRVPHVHPAGKYKTDVAIKFAAIARAEANAAKAAAARGDENSAKKHAAKAEKDSRESQTYCKEAEYFIKGIIKEDALIAKNLPITAAGELALVRQIKANERLAKQNYRNSLTSSDQWHKQRAANSAQKGNSLVDRNQVTHYFNSLQPVRGLVDTYENLYYYIPQTPEEDEIRTFGLNAVEYADDLYAAQEDDEASLYADIAKETADILLGLDPVTGVGRGAYELFTGKNMVTGEDLSKFERSMAALSVLTVGGSNSVKALGKVGSKLSHLIKDKQVFDKAVKAGEKILHARKGIKESTAAIRATPGAASASKALTDSSTMLKHTSGVYGKVPDDVGRQLVNQNFSSFDHFRGEFWKAVSNSKYASEFSASNQAIMKVGNAPFVAAKEALGSRTVYELHHIIPIQHGGPVYDMSNLLVTTPKYHMQVLHAATKAK